MPVNRIIDASNVLRSMKSQVELSDITAALLSKKQVSGGQAEADQAEELRVMSNRLSSLTAAPSSYLHTIVPYITVLDASNNQLRDFQGLEKFTALETLNMSHNQVQVLDAAAASLLLPLRQLQTVILSHNHLKYMDWDVNGNNGSVRESALRRSRAGSLSGEFSSPGAGRAIDEDDLAAMTFTIASIDLSHNDLIELPDLRTLPQLEELYLEDNAIEELTDLETKVPLLHMQTLTLAHNGLTTCAALVPLAALGETLLHLTLGGNPFSSATAHTLSSSGTISSHAKTSLASPTPTTTTTTRTRNNQRSGHGAVVGDATPLDTPPGWWRPFALFLTPLLITLDEADLTEAERRTAGAVLFRPRPGTPLSRSLLELMNPQRSTDLEAYLHRLSVAPVEQTGRARAEAASSVSRSVPAVVTAPLATPAASAATLNASPNGSLDSSARANAAPLPVVVKAMQGKLKSLTNVVQILWHAHINAPAPPLKRLGAGEAGDPDVATVPPGSARSTSSSAAPAEMQDVLLTMRNLQQVMTSMWGDLDDFRGLVAREQFKAAVTIQRHYRGHRARCEWRVLRADYHAFVETLAPEVTHLQRVGRGLLARQRLGPRYALHALRRDVAGMREEMKALHRLVEQRCVAVPTATPAQAARGRHVDPAAPTTTTRAAGDDAAPDNLPHSSGPLKPQRIMVRRRSSSGGSDRGSSLPQRQADPKPAAHEPQSRSAAQGGLPDDDLDEL